jgi:hypothetical protein
MFWPEIFRLEASGEIIISPDALNLDSCPAQPSRGSQTPMTPTTKISDGSFFCAHMSRQDSQLRFHPYVMAMDVPPQTRL